MSASLTFAILPLLTKTEFRQYPNFVFCSLSFLPGEKLKKYAALFQELSYFTNFAFETVEVVLIEAQLFVVELQKDVVLGSVKGVVIESFRRIVKQA